MELPATELNECENSLLGLNSTALKEEEPVCH
jgi:hypothetical protein